MLNNTWSRNVNHNINIECIQFEQPAIHDICEPLNLNGHVMHYSSIEYCPILRARPRAVQSDLLVVGGGVPQYIRCLSISQTWSPGDMAGDSACLSRTRMSFC